jgi:lysophospholipase L1-like esterase
LFSERIVQKGKRVPIILLSGTPVDEDAWHDHCAEVFDEPGMNRDNAVARSYGECVKQVGSDLDCDVVDVFDLMGGNGNDYAKHLSDGLHLSSSGNTIIFEGIMSLVQNKYPHLAPMEGDGKNENSGIPMEEKLWTDLC